MEKPSSADDPEPLSGSSLSRAIECIRIHCDVFLDIDVTMTILPQLAVSREPRTALYRLAKHHETAQLRDFEGVAVDAARQASH